MTKRLTSRRKFLGLVVASAVSTALSAACQQATATVQPPVEKEVTRVVEKQVPATVSVEKEVTRVVEKEIAVTTTPSPKGVVTLELMRTGITGTDPVAVNERELIAAFEAKNPNIKIKPTEIPWPTQREVLITQLVAGTPPDLAVLHSNLVAEIGSSMNGLAVFDDFPGWAQYAEIFVPVRLEAVRSKGKIYGVPWQSLVFSTVCLLPAFKEAGKELPKTWTDMRAAAKAVTKAPQRYGIGYSMGQDAGTAYRVYPYVLSNGGRFMNDDLTKFTFNDQAGQEAIQHFINMKKDGSAVPGMEAWSSANEGDAVKTQLAAMLVGGQWMIYWEPDIQKMVRDWQLSPQPRPEKPTGSAPSRTLSDDTMVTITQQSKNKDEAWTFVQGYQNVENMTARAIRTELGALPVTKGTFSDPRWKQVWGADTYEVDLNASEPWPYTPVLTEATQIYALALSKAYAGQATVKSALDDAVEKCQALLKS